MKQIRTPILSLVALLITIEAHAQVTNIVTLTLSAFVQNIGNNVNGVTTTLPPVKKTVITHDILGYLSQAEWLEPSFGSGAKLALVTDGAPTSGYFVIVDSHLNLLQDVSDIITFSVGTVIFSGKQDFQGNPSPSVKGTELVTITYDDTFSGGSISFSFTGLLNGTVTGTATSLTQKGTLTNGTGQGTYQGIPLVLTGNFSLAGKLIY